MDTKDALKQTIEHVAIDIESMAEGCYDMSDCDGETIEEEFTDFYVLDVNYTVDRFGQLRGANLYVTLGGPTVWVDSMRGVVCGSWGTDSWERGLSQFAQEWVDERVEEMWDCLNANY